jgi:hypothetical protein
MTSTVPFAMLLHTPADAVSAHDLQMPVQVVSQQIFCSQLPDRHSSLVSQIAPFDLRPQRPPVHTAGDRQSASAVHDALQALGLELQRYGKQLDVPGMLHVPAPSQVDSGVCRLVVVGHASGKQGVADGHFWQAPASHLPLVPQVDGSAVVQIPAGSFDPVATFEQTPAVPAVHDLHAPLQALSQQTPCAQNVLRHSAPAEHAAPFSLSPQLLAAQVNGVTHWLLLVQALKQRAPLQMYGLHGSRSGASHLPLALQVDGRLYRLPAGLQVSSPHKVPTGQLWQPPLPSHLPLLAQVDCGITVQTARGSRVPAAIGMQCPGAVASAQLRHAPPQA